MPNPQNIVYIIHSETDPLRYYTGRTSNLVRRMADHNCGGCRHTANATPWRVVVSIAFADERRAIEFERYLKSGSGCAFAVRHFR